MVGDPIIIANKYEEPKRYIREGRIAKLGRVKVPRACYICEVGWRGVENDTCWCCGEEGRSGGASIFIVSNLTNI